MCETQQMASASEQLNSSTSSDRPEELDAFLLSGRTGRRNAVVHPEINKEENSAINVACLAQQLENMKTQTTGSSDEQVPSTSKAVDLSQSLTQPTTSDSAKSSR